MFPQVDEYCKEILSITESKNSLLDKTGRFCSTQIKLFCVYMQARSRIIVNRYDEALSILLPKDLDNSISSRDFYSYPNQHLFSIESDPQ